MFKILHGRLQQYVGYEPPDVQAGFRKGRGTRDPIANSCWTIEEQESAREASTSALLAVPEPLCGSQQTVENSLRDGNTTLLYLLPEKSLCRARSNS